MAEEINGELYYNEIMYWKQCWHFSVFVLSTMQPIANITYIHTFVEELQQFNEKMLFKNQT